MNDFKKNNELLSKDYVCITSDLDWASEAAISMALDFFDKYNIEPTIFVTHKSEAVLKKNLDLGIHPNFIQPSSHGKDISSIIDYCQEIAPDTKCFRCHRWYASNDIYDELSRRGFEYESNICTNMDLVKPFVHRSGMICFPVFFEDGAFIVHEMKNDYEKYKTLFRQSGLKVINFHPMHYALNTPFFKYTREIKDKLSRDDWNSLDESDLNRLSHQGTGIRGFIEAIVDDAVKRGAGIITLKQAYLLLKAAEEL